MSSEDDEDVCVCDVCDDIFLTKSGLKAHQDEKHGSDDSGASKGEEEEKPKKKRMGPASQVKRSRSSSDEEEEKEKVVKKFKMGPRSRVKRDRSSSPEEQASDPIPKPSSPMFNHSSRSVSPAGSSTENKAIDKLVEALASTESEAEKKDDTAERSKDREKNVGDNHKMKKHKKHKDREKDRDRDKDKGREKDRDREKSLKKNKSSERDSGDRQRDKDKHRDSVKASDKKGDKTRHSDKDKFREKSRPKMGPASKVARDKSGSGSSSDDEETNRVKADQAKAVWQKKQDEVKGRMAKLTKTDGAETDDFLASDEEGSKKIKSDRKITLEDLVSVKKKISHDSPKPKKEPEVSGTPKGLTKMGSVQSHDNTEGPECPKCGQVCKDNSNLKNHVLSHYYQVFYDVLPVAKPFPCPICGNCSRDKITMVRHYAFTHKKLFEMTDVTTEDLQGFGTRNTSSPEHRTRRL